MFLFFFSILLSGYLIVALFFNQEKKPLLFKLALAYGLGSFFIALQIFIWLFLPRLDFYLSLFWLVLILENALLFFLIKRKKIKLFYKPKKNKKCASKELLIVSLILTQIIFIFGNALARPTAAYDSMAMWSLKAKILFYENKVDFNHENNFLYLGGANHRNYPWHIPLLQFWLHVNLGEYNDLKTNFIFVFYFLSILILIYYFLLNFIGRYKSLIFTFFLSSMPLIFYHGFNAYADLVLAFYILAGFGLFCFYLENNQKNYLFLSAIFWGAALFTKNEAIIFIIALALSIFLYYHYKSLKIKEVLGFFLLILACALPWFIFHFIHELKISNVQNELGFHPEIMPKILNGLFTGMSWNIWWFIALLTILINFQKIIFNKNILFAWMFLALSFLGFFILYLFTQEYQFALNYTALLRNILVLTPVSLFVAGLAFQEKIIKK